MSDLEKVTTEAFKESVDKSSRGNTLLQDSLSNVGQAIEVATENDDLDAYIGVLTSRLKRVRIAAIAVWGISFLILIARLFVQEGRCL